MKRYIQPQTEFFLIKHIANLCAGSSTPASTDPIFSGDQISGGEGL